MFSACRCNLTASQIYELYSAGNQAEAEESVAMKFVPLSDVLIMQQSNPDLWNSLAPSAKGCFTLFALSVKKGHLTI